MTETEAKWADRVQRWRASGKSADEFAKGEDFKSSTLRFWGSKLKSMTESARMPAMARVVRRRGRPESGELFVCVGDLRILVRHGFDADLLRAVATALAVSK